MSWWGNTAMSTLGNERRVVRVDVTNPKFYDPSIETDISTDDRQDAQTYEDGHTFSRGQLVVFSSVKNAGQANESMDVEFDSKAIMELLLRPQNITACGVVAEAFTDTRPAGNLGGRRRRTNAESRRVALPVTFNGVEHISGVEPHTGFAPGDYVYLVATGNNRDPFKSTKLCRYDELQNRLTNVQTQNLETHRGLVENVANTVLNPGVDPVRTTPFANGTVTPAIYVGIAHTHADRGATSAEVLFAPV